MNKIEVYLRIYLWFDADLDAGKLSLQLERKDKFKLRLGLD